MFTCVIPGEPVPKGRPRCSCIGGRPRLRTPAQTRQWESAAAAIMRSHWSGPAYDGPVRLTVRAYFSRPKSRRGEVWAHTHRSDADNVLKAVADAIQTAGILTDDRRVVHCEVYKLWDESPRVEIQIREMT